MPTGTITSEFKSDTGFNYEIVIQENDSTSDYSISDVTLSSRGFDLTYQTEDKDRFTGLIPSELQWDIFIEADANQTLLTAKIEQIRQAPYKKFQVYIKKGTSRDNMTLWWAGNLFNDINPQKDESVPTMVTLTAGCGLSYLARIPFNDVTPYAFARYNIIQFFINAFKNDIDTEKFWATDETFIETLIDWTTSNQTRSQARDPFVENRFNAMAFRSLNEKTGEYEFEDGFTLLDNICHTFGARCFLANGVWTIIQVNHYDYMADNGSAFIRRYLKANTGTAPSSDDVANFNQTEGTDTIRLAGGTFDYLPVLRNVVAVYNHEEPLDFDFVSFTNGDGSTNTNLQSNEIVAWNGFISADGTSATTSSIYGINNANITDMMSVNLGEIIAQTGGTLRFKRLFSLSNSDGPIIFVDAATPLNQQQLLARIYTRFKLVGSTDTYYANNFNVAEPSEWVTANNYTGSPTDIYANLAYTPPNNFGYNLEASTELVEFETEPIPEDGTLYLEVYARVYYNSVNGFLFNFDDNTEVVEGSAAINEDEIIVFSSPETEEEFGIFYLLDGQNIITQEFEAINQPGGTTITNGETYEVEETLIGSGPNAGSVGKIESFDGTNWQPTDYTWRSYGNTTNLRIHRLLVNEILQGQQKGAKMYNGQLKNVNLSLSDADFYNYNNAISIDSVLYIPYECTYNGETDTWNGQWYEASRDGTNITDNDKIVNDKDRDRKKPIKVSAFHN